MPARRRNNKRKKGRKGTSTAARDEKQELSHAAGAEDRSESDSEGSAAEEAGDAKEQKQAKLSPHREASPAPAEKETECESPQIAESKLDAAAAGSPRRGPATGAASPIGHAAPGSSEKPTRPTTPAASETSSAKSTARPVKPRSGASDDRSDHDEIGSAEKSHYDRIAVSPEAKRLSFEAKSEEKSSAKRSAPPSDRKIGSGAKAIARDEFSSPAPGENPPDGIVESFRSARKAIENSVDAGEKRKRRERSDSLDEVLKEHPDIVDPYTGEVSGNLFPSEDVLQHHNRMNAAKELVGMGTVSSNLKQLANKSPKHNTAIALTNTAKALEGTLKMPKKVERRPSLNILMDSGILVIPENSSPQPNTGSAHRNLSHLEEQKFLDSMSPTASKSRVAADSPLVSAAKAKKIDGVSRDISAPAFSSPLPSSETHIYQYVPYKILERRVVIALALRILSELRRRAMVNEEQVGFAKLKIFRGDIDVVMAVEQFACNRDLEVFVALMYDIASENPQGVHS